MEKNVDLILVLKNMKKKCRSDFSFEKHGEKWRFDFSSKKSWRKIVDLIFVLKNMEKKCRSDFFFEKHGTFMMDSLADLKKKFNPKSMHQSTHQNLI